MNNREIGIKLGERIRGERQMTNEILALINSAFAQRAYLDHGFSSMFDWLVRGFGYSNASAYRRIEAARLLRAVPEVSKKLESGAVNLTNLSKAQSVIKAQEKLTGEKVSVEQKAAVLAKLENKTEMDAQRTLLELFPATSSLVHHDKRTIVSETQVRLSVNLSKEAEANLNRAKEILSHKFPHAKDSEIVDYALKFLIEKTDPIRKTRTQVASGPEAIRVKSTEAKTTSSGAPCGHNGRKTRFLEHIKTGDSPRNFDYRSQTELRRDGIKTGDHDNRSQAAIRREVMSHANAACTFVDPVSGRRCGSKYQVQIDHIIPKALGGTDAKENLRALCRVHNIHAAEIIFGKTHMSNFRQSLI